MKLESIEVVADRTAESRCDEGFLRVARFTLRNRYVDGGRSQEYSCDVVSRVRMDAVVAVLYAIDAERRVQVILVESPRPPVYLRRLKDLQREDVRDYTLLREVVAGLIEPEDGTGFAGLARRAAAEALEEAGITASAADFRPLGGECFASPGVSDELIHFTSCETDLAARGEAQGDGSVMEECSEVVVMELGEALAACRRGEIADMKTELALGRLADQIGYLPQLGCFAAELPRELRKRYQRPGLTGRDGRTGA